jgi:hypothetical protein
MGKPDLSLSENFLPPKTLAERLKAQANGHAEIEAASFMAERFAPDLPTQPESVAPEPEGQAPGDPFSGPGPAPGLRNTAWMVLAFALVALVPIIAFGTLYSRGALSVTGLSAVVDSAEQTVQLPEEQPALVAPEDEDDSQPAMQAALADMAAPETILPKRAIELPSATLSVPNAIAVEAGKAAPFAIAIDAEDSLPPRTIVSIRGLPEGTIFSAGRPFGDTEWSLRPDEIDGLRLTLPAGANGERALSVAVLSADGSVIASAATRLDIAPDPKQALISRPDEAARIAELIEHGRKMVSVGYFPGARAYFQRAAEAGSAEAAFSVASTYDPSFIEEIGAQGIKPDLKQARVWYERAKALGHKDADAQLRALAKAEAQAATSPAPKRLEPASAPDATPTPAAAPAIPAARAEDVDLGWVEISSPVNVRSAPTPQSQTLKIAVPGKRYQATGRQGSWVQVTDPATAETGWVYNRYVAVSEAPGR